MPARLYFKNFYMNIFIVNKNILSDKRIFPPFGIAFFHLYFVFRTECIQELAREIL